MLLENQIFHKTYSLSLIENAKDRRKIEEGSGKMNYEKSGIDL